MLQVYTCTVLYKHKQKHTPILFRVLPKSLQDVSHPFLIQCWLLTDLSWPRCGRVIWPGPPTMGLTASWGHLLPGYSCKLSSTFPCSTGFRGSVSLWKGYHRHRRLWKEYCSSNNTYCTAYNSGTRTVHAQPLQSSYIHTYIHSSTIHRRSLLSLSKTQCTSTVGRAAQTTPGEPTVTAVAAPVMYVHIYP